MCSHRLMTYTSGVANQPKAHLLGCKLQALLTGQEKELRLLATAAVTEATSQSSQKNHTIVKTVVIVCGEAPVWPMVRRGLLCLRKSARARHLHSVSLTDERATRFDDHHETWASPESFQSPRRDPSSTRNSHYRRM